MTPASSRLRGGAERCGLNPRSFLMNRMTLALMTSLIEDYMSKVVLHPKYYPRLNTAIESVVSGIRRANLEEWLARLGETEWNNVIVEAVKTELMQPSMGVATVMKLLKRAA